MASRIVIALGGNALQKQGEASAIDQQKEAVQTARQLVPLIAQGHQIVIVHGNGPQVGDILLHEEAINTSENPTMPLDSCGAMSQGSIGYWLQQAIGNELKKQGIDMPVATVLTQTVVDSADVAFQNPSKPIGPFYASESEARTAAEARKFVVKEDSGRGWRRVVPSPMPKSIVEKPVIEELINKGYLVIAAGGGGVPVVETDDGFKGVEAVIDKDMSAAVMADMIDAETLIILTSVDAVTIHFRKPDETALHRVTVEEMQHYCDTQEFGAGSMMPKVLASIAFVQKKRGRRKTIIGSLDKVQQSIAGETGTIIS
ncbi:MAG: carbamate kinase [Candidatus Saccharibacteria bacterium]|nr:carbamate kinase [Candidatus Saccharibacteria bacterium]